MSVNSLPDNYPLISVDELKGLLDRQKTDPPTLHILDCRFELANPAKGPQDFLDGHIPGARYVHIDNDLCSEKTGQNGRHPLPDFFEFVLLTQQWGLKKDDLIVAMDAANAMVAGRLWWMLRWAGYPSAKVLNGGWKAWVSAGYERAVGAAGVPAPATESKAAPSAGRQPDMQTVDVHQVVSNLNKRDFQLIDGRDAERFTGVRDTMDPVAGHIPGARNRNFLENLNADGTFKSPAQLQQEFNALLGDLKPDQIVHSCGSGVTACSNLLAMEIAGLSGSRLYPGSWSEYCADPSRPVERGS